MNNKPSEVLIHFHVNGAIVLIAAIYLYYLADFHWGLFAALLLFPDIFMLGYVAGPQFGTRLYNIGHSFIWPAVLGLAGLTYSSDLLLSFALIWLAHIGMDHLFGYGYKYVENFKSTHYSRI